MTRSPLPGPTLFARFAYPPNELGYCGPDAARELLEHAHAGVSDGGLRERAREFDGAWPYLELIAHEHGLADPLDARVVEAYWIGNDLLDRVGVRSLGDSMELRFRPLAPRAWAHVADVVQHEPRPHHNFHVFCVTPWIGFLRGGAHDHALAVLDRCRVRWGRVSAVDGATAVVEARPLVWSGERLGLGAARAEVVRVAADGYRLEPRARVGDVVALHWDWICHRLDARQARALAHETTRQLTLANQVLLREVVSPGPLDGERTEVAAKGVGPGCGRSEPGGRVGAARSKAERSR